MQAASLKRTAEEGGENVRAVRARTNPESFRGGCGLSEHAKHIFREAAAIEERYHLSAAEILGAPGEAVATEVDTPSPPQELHLQPVSPALVANGDLDSGMLGLLHDPCVSKQGLLTGPSGEPGQGFGGIASVSPGSPTTTFGDLEADHQPWDPATLELIEANFSPDINDVSAGYNLPDGSADFGHLLDQTSAFPFMNMHPTRDPADAIQGFLIGPHSAETDINGIHELDYSIQDEPMPAVSEAQLNAISGVSELALMNHAMSDAMELVPMDLAAEVQTFEDSSPASSAVTDRDESETEELHRPPIDSTGFEWTMVQYPNGLPHRVALPPKEANEVSPPQLQWVYSADSPQPSQKKKRQPFQDEQKRLETSQTRRLKACVRCRMQKVRCETNESDPTGVCKTCEGLSRQKIYTLPCVRHKITECVLFRRGKAPGLQFTGRWPSMKLKDINEWATDEVRTVQVESDVCPVPLELIVRRFVLRKGDANHRGWMDGRNKKFTKTTSWAITCMSAAVQDLKVYVKDHVFTCMDYFLQDSDELVIRTYDFARTYMKRTPIEDERELLKKFFYLWFAIRRTAITEHLAGKETLDMALESDTTFPLFGKIPLPPVMVQQLDMILTLGILDPTQKSVLEDFHKLVLERKPRSWMIIYLITFMSLHCCACITAENYQNARKQGLRRRYAMSHFIAERHHGANVFLSHYHYFTQQGNPFTMDWKRRHTTAFSDFSTDDIHFIKRTNEMVEEREARMRVNLEENLYEDELFFIAQMYKADWSPRDSVIDHTEGTVNNVPLRLFYGVPNAGQA